MKKNVGFVFWANSRKIDKSDSKPRRQYVVAKDTGKYIGVSKIRGFNDNPKNNERLFELKNKEYPLNKKSGIDKKVYSKRADNNKPLKLTDYDIFDKTFSFKLSSHDTHRLLVHTGLINTNKKGRKN